MTLLWYFLSAPFVPIASDLEDRKMILGGLRQVGKPLLRSRF